MDIIYIYIYIYGFTIYGLYSIYGQVCLIYIYIWNKFI